ncbi:tetratricopeptide repeat protein [Aquimonas voraii]|uniref:Biofilm PGA synthesis protein PgaA n=1 Tax=Aquimonas voraii TaxID=265719 RepID=A0A1G6Y2T3_9GAMM|nr:tetratricopeptide repeat protein [Aquimonas voraii]SDD84253.1 biofilm PGA synthesis protein PgaA [Aquimonas voraii]
MLKPAPLILAFSLASLAAALPLAAAAQSTSDALRHGVIESEALMAAATESRRKAEWPQALDLYAQVLQLRPGHAPALRERALTLQLQGAALEAWRQYRAQPALFSATEALGFELDALARRLNWAQLEADPQRREALLLALLDEYSALESGPAAADAGALQRLRNDRLLVLQLLGRHAEVIAQFEQRAEQDIALPAWLRLPVADSLMAQREPARAQALLEAVLADEPAQATAHVLLAYALLEQEKHDEARDLLADWRRAQPPFDAEGRANWAHAGVDLNSVLIDNFSEQIHAAHARIAELSDLSPLDAGLLEARAGIERRRGWAEQALLSARMAITESPDWVLPRAAEIEALLDLDRVREARTKLDAFIATHGEHRQAQGVQQRWQRRQGAQWNLEALRARSTLLDEASSGPLGPGGNAEFRALAHWQGPLLDDAWRLGALAGVHWADFQGQRIERQRAAFTLSRQQDRLGFGLEAGRTFDDFVRETTMGGWLRYRHSDVWRSSIALWRHAPFASLQARAAGIRADGIQLGLSRSSDERSRSGLSLEQLRYEDGNVRTSAYLAHRQRLRAQPRGEWYTRLGLGAGRASREDAPYFNPRRDASADAGLTLDRVLTREYSEAWRLRIDVDVSRGWQDGYGSHWTPAIEVMPRWQWRIGHEASLGLRWSRPVYDGRREERWALVLRMGGGE